MSITYNASTNFGAKDALPINDPNKVIYGAQFTTEFNSISAAFANAAPTSNATFTGTATFENVDINGTTVTIGSEAISDTLIGGWNTTKATVDAGATGWDATKTTVDAGAANWDTAYGWGDHSAAGYGSAGAIPTDNNQLANGAGYITASQGTFTGDVTGANFNTTGGDIIRATHSGIHLSTNFIGGINSSGALSDGAVDVGNASYQFKDGYFSGDVTTDTVSIGDWEIKLDGSDLRFIYNGTDRIRFTTAGAIIAEDNVTAYGSA